MKSNYYSEIEDMMDFWNEVNLSCPFNDNIYVCNTDGRTQGCLIEFKLNALDLTKM